MDNVPSERTVYRWCKDFLERKRTTISDAPRSGRPCSSSADASVAAINNAIGKAPKISARQLLTMLNIPRTSVHRALTQELLLSKVCSVWVPHALSDRNKAERVAGAKAIRALLRAENEEDLARKYVTDDETWIFFEPLMCKEENNAWLAPGEPRHRVIRQDLTWQKTLLLVAFTCDKKFSVGVTQQRETIDSQRYIDFVHSTGEKWRALRRSPVKLSDIWWQHDNARPHTSGATDDFFSRRHIQRVRQPPYSPDMNLCDRFLFKYLKKELRKSTYSTADEVCNASLHVLNAIPEERLLAELWKLREHCGSVIACNGDYVTQ